MNLRYFLANVCVNAIKSELNGDLRLENNETCSILYGFKRSLSHPSICSASAIFIQEMKPIFAGGFKITTIRSAK